MEHLRNTELQLHYNRLRGDLVSKRNNQSNTPYLEIGVLHRELEEINKRMELVRLEAERRGFKLI